MMKRTFFALGELVSGYCSNTQPKAGKVTANATKTDGEIIEELQVPSGKIDINIHFEIDGDETTYLLIDMEADWVAISKSNRLRPVFKATIAEPPPEGTSEE